MENSSISVLHSRGEILHEVGFLSAGLVTGGLDLGRKGSSCVLVFTDGRNTEGHQPIYSKQIPFSRKFSSRSTQMCHHHAPFGVPLQRL